MVLFSSTVVLFYVVPQLIGRTFIVITLFGCQEIGEIDDVFHLLQLSFYLDGGGSRTFDRLGHRPIKVGFEKAKPIKFEEKKIKEIWDRCGVPGASLGFTTEVVTRINHTYCGSGNGL